MKLTVKLFARYAELAGWRERELDVPAGSSSQDVLDGLRKADLRRLPVGARPLFAKNRAHVPAETVLEDGDELAIMPPVSGGSGDERDPTRRIVISAEPLDATALTALVRSPSFGALAVFEGVVRDHGGGHGVSSIDYELYPEMASAVLARIRDEVETVVPGTLLALAHRHGELVVGEVSVVVACGAAHRRDAFHACRLAMDRIKESLPAWKRERRTDGTSAWLD